MIKIPNIEGLKKLQEIRDYHKQIRHDNNKLESMMDDLQVILERS